MLYDVKLSASTPAPRTTRAKALQAAGVRAVCSRLCMQPTQTRSPFARFRTPRHRGPCHHPPRSHGPRPLPSSPPSAKGPPPPPPPPPQPPPPPPPPPRAPLFDRYPACPASERHMGPGIGGRLSQRQAQVALSQLPQPQEGLGVLVPLRCPDERIPRQILVINSTNSRDDFDEFS